MVSLVIKLRLSSLVIERCMVRTSSPIHSASWQSVAVQPLALSNEKMNDSTILSVLFMPLSLRISIGNFMKFINGNKKPPKIRASTLKCNRGKRLWET